jgi:hypothetical protein
MKFSWVFVCLVLLLTSCINSQLDCDLECLEDKKADSKEYHSVYEKITNLSVSGVGDAIFEDHLEVWEKGDKAKYVFSRKTLETALSGLDINGNISFCLDQPNGRYCENIPYEDDFFLVTEFTTDHLLPLFPSAKAPEAVNGLSPDEHDLITGIREEFKESLEFIGLKEGESCFDAEDLEVCYNSEGFITSFSKIGVSDAQGFEERKEEVIELKSIEYSVSDDVFVLD